MGVMWGYIERVDGRALQRRLEGRSKDISPPRGDIFFGYCGARVNLPRVWDYETSHAHTLRMNHAHVTHVTCAQVISRRTVQHPAGAVSPGGAGPNIMASPVQAAWPGLACFRPRLVIWLSPGQQGGTVTKTVTLTRMATEKIADRRRMFELFTEMRVCPPFVQMMIILHSRPDSLLRVSLLYSPTSEAFLSGFHQLQSPYLLAIVQP
jgi:hypothetical protein